jgi:hypothetical protein
VLRNGISKQQLYNLVRGHVRDVLEGFTTGKSPSKRPFTSSWVRLPCHRAGVGLRDGGCPLPQRSGFHVGAHVHLATAFHVAVRGSMKPIALTERARGGEIRPMLGLPAFRWCRDGRSACSERTSKPARSTADLLARVPIRDTCIVTSASRLVWSMNCDSWFVPKNRVDYAGRVRRKSIHRFSPRCRTFMRSP